MVDAALRARAAALAPPRAYPAVPPVAVLRAVPEDFVVEEELGFDPAGAGAHVLLRVRKCEANTQWVARELARAAGCRPAEVGYAGLKDRRAVAIQWFSVPRPRAARDFCSVRGAGFEVLEAHAHTRKLPRGALAGNRFAIRVRAVDEGGGELAARLAEPLAELSSRGVPNYFGPQRFGRGGANLALASLPPHGSPGRGFVLSAARSVLFNALLAERVADGSWERLLPGDIASLDGRGSVFPVAQVDATLEARCRRLEIHPTGALWGTGMPASGAAVQALESRVAQLFAEQASACAAAGMRQERRSLRVAVRELGCEATEDGVLLRFRLARGCFATAVLRELIQAPHAAAPALELPEA